MPTKSPTVRGFLPGAARSIARHHQNLKKDEYTDPKRLGKAHGTLKLTSTCKESFQLAASDMDVL
jgi:hypothetical protein